MLEPRAPVKNIHQRWGKDQPLVQRLTHQFELDRFFLDFPELKWMKDEPPTVISKLRWYKTTIQSSWDSAALGISDSLAKWLLEPEQELLRRNWAQDEGKLDPAITDAFQELKTLEDDPEFPDSTEVGLHREWVIICADALNATWPDVHKS